MLLADTDSPQGGGTAYWPRSHLANHRFFLAHPELFDGSYLSTEPVKSGGHVALLEDDPSVGEVTCVTGKASHRRDCHPAASHSTFSIGVSIGMERERQQNDSLANG